MPASLPPPPDRPQRSPPVVVSGEVPLRIGLAGEPKLEALARVPVGAKRAVVLCHPHPLYGGSMHSPIVLMLAKFLAEQAANTTATLRFHFRGVPASEGVHDNGRGEVQDVRAAVAELRTHLGSTPVTIAGHSFGSWVGLAAARMDPSVDRVALVAPSVRFFEFEKGPLGCSAKTAIFVGDQDEYVSVEEARTLARDLGAEITVFEGSDHHFLRARRKLVQGMFDFLVPEHLEGDLPR